MMICGALVVFGVTVGTDEHARIYVLWVAEDHMPLAIKKPVGSVLFTCSEL